MTSLRTPRNHPKTHDVDVKTIALLLKLIAPYQNDFLMFLANASANFRRLSFQNPNGLKLSPLSCGNEGLA